jgi:hypothetical protein
MKLFKNISRIIINSFQIVYYKTIIIYYKLLQDIFHSYPFHYNITKRNKLQAKSASTQRDTPHNTTKRNNDTTKRNTPPSKLGRAWVYSMKDEQQESIKRSHKKVDYEES